MSKLYKVIESLPDEPDKKIVWVSYNSDMSAGAKELFRLIKGEAYADNVIFVTRDEVGTVEGNIYYSPDLYDHIGNGAN